MSDNPYSLSGKTILVTGASSGIGRSTAIECSKMGAKLIITARDTARLDSTYKALDGEGHRQIIADLVDAVSVEKLLSELPTLDGIVLCAGKGLTLPLQFASKDRFEDIFGINFYAPVELLRLLYKKKKISKEGSVVIIASLGGTQIFSGGNSIYGASKAAINSIMKFAANEFAPRKIRVNSICPGMVDTPLIHRGTISDEQLKLDLEKYPLKRYGVPEDIAYLAIYLLSDASTWLTGQDIVIDGGRSLT